MGDHHRYTYRATWSKDDGEWVGTCIEFPSLSHLAPAAGEAMCGIQELAESVAADMQASGNV